MELKKIGVLSAGKIALLFGAVYGLLSGIMFSVLISKADVLAAAGMQFPSLITNFGYWIIIIAPVLNGAIYFIVGIIVAALYNLFSNWIGGIQLDLKK